MLVNVCVYTHMCICDSFCGYNSGLLCISSYIDFFSRAMSECLNSGHLNRKTFCYFCIQSSSQLRKSPHICGPARIQGFLDASDGAAILSF